MKLINRTKKYSKLMNSNKNKINSEIIFIFHPNPNTHLYELTVFVLYASIS